MEACSIPISKVIPLPATLNTINVIDEVTKEVDSISKGLIEKFDYLRVTAEDDLPFLEPIVKIGGGAFAARHDFSVIAAAAKAGKSALASVILAMAISKTGLIDGFPEITVEQNQPGHAVLHFDTEQSKEDQQYNIKTVLKRAGLNSTPEYFLSYNIRQLGTDEYREVTENICREAKTRFGGIHLILIDGGADYIKSVNDEEAASDIIQFFTHLAIKYDCAVIVIIHQNPGSNKERGHLGSQAQRKCYGMIEIERDGDISTIKPKMLRKAGFSDMPQIHFRYSKDAGYHVPVDAPDKEANKDKMKRLRIERIAQTVFAPPASYRTNEAIRKIAREGNFSETTAKRSLKDLELWEVIIKGDDGFFRLNIERGQMGSNGVK